jgi:septal ring factor EnvC (AmiA/AmiB activator)
VELVHGAGLICIGSGVLIHLFGRWMLERISVNIGQFVLTGEPVATMGTTVPGRIYPRDQRESARALCRVP